jgi:hypothetical protein
MLCRTTLHLSDGLFVISVQWSPWLHPQRFALSFFTRSRTICDKWRPESFFNAIYQCIFSVCDLGVDQYNLQKACSFCRSSTKWKPSSNGVSPDCFHNSPGTCLGLKRHICSAHESPTADSEASLRSASEFLQLSTFLPICDRKYPKLFEIHSVAHRAEGKPFLDLCWTVIGFERKFKMTDTCSLLIFHFSAVSLKIIIEKQTLENTPKWRLESRCVAVLKRRCKSN